ncbi:MAG: VanZ family protein [Planctomycetes bacterium]|nr:VanZ family protein [Planctomycetota bacterium]
MEPFTAPIWLRWIPATTYAGLIFVASSLPQPIPYIPIPQIDKPIHTVEYAILCLLICWAQSAGRPGEPVRPIKKVILFSIIASSLYGVSDEVHQYFVPGRNSDVVDWAFDTVGASLAGLLWYRRDTSFAEEKFNLTKRS